MNNTFSKEVTDSRVRESSIDVESSWGDKRSGQYSTALSSFGGDFKRLPRRIGSVSSVSYQGTLVSERDLLYDNFRPLVQRLVRKYGDNPELRKDLVGEIYCLFCGIVDAYDPARGVPFKPYVVHQLSSSVYTYARKHWRQERREVRLELCDDTTTGGVSAATDPSQQWNHDITMRQLQEFIATAIAKLPLRQRQVVIWRYFEHRSFEEIAEALHIQVATARSSLRHGLNNIRRSFEKANLLLDA